MIAVEAVGCRLVLRAIEVVDETLKRAKQAGFVLARETEDDEKRAQAGVDQGVVLAIGPNVDAAYVGGVEVGDTVAIAKYSGKIISALEDKEDKYLIVNDQDVVAKYRSKNG